MKQLPLHVRAPLIRPLYEGESRSEGEASTRHPVKSDPSWSRFVLIALVLMLLPSCGRKTLNTPGIIARVGDAVITQDAFQAELNRRAQHGQSIASPAEREAVLNDMIRVETFFAKARASGFDRDPELALQFKRMVVAKYEDMQWKKEPPLRKPEPGEMQLFYDSHKDQFTSPEKVHVAVIFQRVSAKAREAQVGLVKSKMEALRRQALGQAAQQSHFGLLAQENSDDQATRYRGGDCGFLTRASAKVRWDHTVRDAAFALKAKGEISPVLRAPDGFYLLRLIERKEAEVAPLALVRERIEKHLFAAEQKRAREKFEAAERRGLEVEINDALLRSIEAPAVFAKRENAAPPAMPVQ
ncbi:MAG: peptidyl-prolyl cis-trans isomerase [Verrucomicrobia bacterium]|nr:peptidyl-prolyl cis-trans isomerase [Verrucomicrobiota bacterium]